MTRELLLEYICPGYRAPNCFKGDISFNCSDCNRVLNEMLDKYDKHVIEQHKADTNLKDTIKDIHDNVANEMYCKGIDDVVIKIKECVGMDWEWDFMFIEQIAEQLKAGDKG